MGTPLLSEAEALVTPLQGLDRLAIGFKRLLPGQPLSSPFPCPPSPPASAIIASLAAPEPRIDASPRVSQACVTAPRRHGGLSESEGTVRVALRPAPFRSAEPEGPGSREGGTRLRLPQPHALPPPQRAERTAGES